MMPRNAARRFATLVPVMAVSAVMLAGALCVVSPAHAAAPSADPHAAKTTAAPAPATPAASTPARPAPAQASAPKATPSAARPAADPHAAAEPPASGHGAPAPAPAPAAAGAHAHVASPAPADADRTPDKALAELVSGNERYVDGAPKAPHRDEARRCATAAGQHPPVAVLTCADSRVSPEILFDQGIGDLFVVRVAGNVAATNETGTLEYGVEHLGVAAIVVLGHSRCGAVKAAVEHADAHGDLGSLLAELKPVADQVTSKSGPTLTGPALVSAAVRANVRYNVQRLLSRSPVIAEAVKAGKLKVVGAVYDIHAGSVQWLTDVAGPATAAQIAPPTDTPAATPKDADAAHDTHTSKPAASHDATKASEDPHAVSTTAGEDHDTDATTRPTAKGENWIALGGLGATSLAASAGIITLLSKLKSA